jgi:cysteine desulfurase
VPGYLDHAATAPLRPEARAAMEPWLGPQYGNPSGSHDAARRARRAVDDARDQVAAALGRKPGEVVFTSGGTEADNLAAFGVHGMRGGTVLCGATEHPAVGAAVERVGGRTVPVGRDGQIDLDALRTAVDEHTTLVSVMAVNNETGIIAALQPVIETVKAVNPDTIIHTDAVQAVCWTDVVRQTEGVDLLSVSAHKFGGPQGVGALIVPEDLALAPMLVGGGQERDRRSGTHNVAGVVGAGAAITTAVDHRDPEIARIRVLRDRLLDGLLGAVPQAVQTTSDRGSVVAGTAHVCLTGIESEALLFLLEQGGIQASAASSCASGAQEPSHVLSAMGLDNETAGGSLRLSLGWTTTDADVDLALDVVPAACERLALFA